MRVLRIDDGGRSKGKGGDAGREREAGNSRLRGLAPGFWIHRGSREPKWARA